MAEINDLTFRLAGFGFLLDDELFQQLELALGGEVSPRSLRQTVWRVFQPHAEFTDPSVFGILRAIRDAADRTDDQQLFKSLCIFYARQIDLRRKLKKGQNEPQKEVVEEPPVLAVEQPLAPIPAFKAQEKTKIEQMPRKPAPPAPEARVQAQNDAFDAADGSLLALSDLMKSQRKPQNRLHVPDARETAEFQDLFELRDKLQPQRQKIEINAKPRSPAALDFLELRDRVRNQTRSDVERLTDYQRDKNFHEFHKLIGAISVRHGAAYADALLQQFRGAESRPAQRPEPTAAPKQLCLSIGASKKIQEVQLLDYARLRHVERGFGFEEAFVMVRNSSKQ